MRTGDRTISEPYWVYAIAGALMTGGPVWHYLYVNHYPFRVEAVILPGVAALIGALIAVLARGLGNIVGTLAFAALLFIFVDLQSDLLEHVPMLLVAAECVGLAQLFWWRRAAVVCITLGAFYLTTLPRFGGHVAWEPTDTRSTPAPSRPLLLHVILDEQWGPGGLRAAGDSTTGAFLENFYSERGFEVYSAAYSRWKLTRFSIPDILALGQQFAVDSFAPKRPEWTERRMTPRTNPYFARLRQLGYKIHVYESWYLDYCNTPGTEVVSCDKTPSNSISNIAFLDARWTLRARLAGRYFLNLTSKTYTSLKPDTEVWRRSIIGGAFGQFDRLMEDLRTVETDGAAFFVHVLMPHNPLEVDSDCSVYSNLSQRVAYGKNRQPLSDSLWDVRLHLYAGQTRCVQWQIANLLAAIDSSVGRDHSIVIIHGDHGSRMLKYGHTGMRLSLMDAAQLNSVFPTLLAVRRPGVPGAVYPEAVPLQDFMWSLIKSDFTAKRSGPWRHFIRAVPSDLLGEQTVRTLDSADMVWADTTQ